MDSGNMSETLGETAQPDEVVVTDSEATEATPQAEATEEVEFYVEEEGNQSTEPNKMDERQTRAAWKEEKRKRKERTAEAVAEKERADRLEKRLEEMESKVTQATRGKRPSSYDFDSDEEFDAAYDKWRSHGKAESKPARAQAQAQGQAFNLSDDQEYHLHKSELTLKKSLKDYDDVKHNVSNELKRAFGLKDDYPIMEQMAGFAHTYGVDPAKAFYALDKLPGKIDDLVKNAANPAQIGRILRDLEKAVKVRDRKPVSSKPEPNIKGGGPVNLMQKEVDNAFEKYKDNPTQHNHALLTAARKRVKENKVS